LPNLPSFPTRRSSDLGGDIYPGRTFTRLEDLSNSAVAVISRKLEDQLFRGRDPVGQTIKVAGVPYSVIGVYTPPASLFSGSAQPDRKSTRLNSSHGSI